MAQTRLFRSVTYTSRAAVPFGDDALQHLRLEAARLNALDGITGLLVFNGSRFGQTIEGSDDAIEDLLGRLRRDPRHEAFNILADTVEDHRHFRSWDMQLLSLPEDRAEALAITRSRFEESDRAAREKLYETVEGVFA